MLITRAPVRISFGGGGTDLAAYYERYGGMVVSATINKFFYTIVSPTHNGSAVQVISSDYQTFYRHHPTPSHFWNGNLQLPRAVLHHFGLERGYDLFLASEVPPGTGLGSSGSVAVTLVSAVSALCGRALSRHDLAETASYIEIQRLGMPVGKQDQYAAAFGGLNTIRFDREGVTVEPLRLPEGLCQRLEQGLMLFFTGSTRESSNILRQQKQASERNEQQVIQALHTIKALALAVRDALQAGDLDGFGALLHEGWQYKKKLAANVSTTHIDHCYELARVHGARGGKLTGAGGGGFLMLYCPPPQQQAVTEALEREGLVRMDFHFDFQGVAVLLNTLARPISSAQRLAGGCSR